jgi:hypothetical protein
MKQETRTCQNCKTSFLIDQKDFTFYEQMQVPPPTWCPRCRMRRRMLFRNERTLYKAMCKLCGTSVISMYPADTPYTVYCFDCWNSDRWDPLAYARDYDFNRPFFEQFDEFLRRVPRPSVEVSQNVNCPYTNYTWECKNCYLTPSTMYCENVAFSKRMEKSADCYDCYQVVESQLCYECVNCVQCASSTFLTNSKSCMDSAFLFDCTNCSHCFMSANLRNKSYVIENRQYDRDGYAAKLVEYRLDTRDGFERAKRRFQEVVEGSIHRYAQVYHSVNSTGDRMYNAKNCKACFDIHDIENVRYTQSGFSIKDVMDTYGVDDEQWCYENINDGLYSSYIRFCANTHTNCLDVRFCDYCRSSSHLLACISVRSKSYCIFNKQYTKEEYEPLVEKIVRHMAEQPYRDVKGRTFAYGEFWPPALSPFGYNETAAQEYFPIIEIQAAAEGFKWKQPERRHYDVTLQPNELKDIGEITDDILNEIIGCEHSPAGASAKEGSGTCNHLCPTAFRIIPGELQFYRRMKLPLPRLCPNCRHAERMRRTNPVELWHRTCECGGASARGKRIEERGKVNEYRNTVAHFHGDGPCPNEFETSYSPDRPEIVYCETCYNAEVV